MTMNYLNCYIMDINVAERLKKSLLLFCAFLFSLSIFAQPVPPDPFATASLSASCNVIEACPQEPVAFELTNIGETKEFVCSYEWATSKQGEVWTDVRKLTVPSKTYMMEEQDLNVRLIATAYFNDAEVYTHEFKYSVKQRKDCKIKECHQTSTGEYYGGTDFNFLPGASFVDWSRNPPEGLEEYFTKQGIEFIGKSGSIQTQTDLGVPLHIDDSLNLGGSNHFYVQNNVNGDFFTIHFPHDRFENNNYRFTMRFYLILPPNQGPNDPTCLFGDGAKMQARTLHGNQTVDYLDIEIFDDASNQLVTSQMGIKNENDVAWYDFTAKVRDDYYGKYKYLNTTVYRFEMTYYGYLPTTTAEYQFTPRFEQFPSCAKLAIDYISAEAEGACLDPSIACVDSIATVHAAGFARAAVYDWKKYSDCNYTTVVPWQPGEVTYYLDNFNNKEQADIKILDKGVFYYTLSDANTEIRFSLGGQICGSAFGPGIDGNPNVCIPSFPYRQHYALKDLSVLDWIHENGDEYGFKWWLEYPNGETADQTQVFLDIASDKQSADLVVASDLSKLSSSYNPDQPYKLYVTSHIVNQTTKELESVYESKDSIILWLYDQPDVSRLNFVTKRGEDTICVAKSSDTIVLVNKEDVMGYTWNFTGAKMEDSIIHIEGYDKTALCNTVDATFPVSLEVVNGVCKATLNDTFRIHSTDAPTIDCSKLSEPSTYFLDKGRLDTTIYLPIPHYETSCDDDPDLNVTIHFVADDPIHSFDSTYTLHKAQIMDKAKTALTLFAGKGDVSYNLVDGCGKSASCNFVLNINDTVNVVVDCNLVKDYDLEVTPKESCVAHPGSNLKIEVPELPDLTFTDTTILVKAQYAGRSQLNLLTDPDVDVTKYSMEKGLYDDYPVGTTYILWKFADPSGNAMYCRSRVSVKSEAPSFDCDSISLIRTSVNKNPYMVYGYASAQAQNNVNPDTKYSLAKLLTIPSVNPEYCGNAHLNIRFTGKCVNDNGDSVAYAKDSVITEDELLKHRFPIGLTTVYYEFCGDNFDYKTGKYDTVSCSQDVVISSGNVPVPYDCPENTSLYVDPYSCLAPSPYTMADVPKAKVSYFCETKYTYDACYPTPYQYDNLGLSAELSKDYDTIIYPMMVRRILYLDNTTKAETDSTIVMDCVSLFTEKDSVPVKKVQHRNGEFNTVCAEDPIEMMALKITNISELPSCVTDSFPRGFHMLIWYFDNGKGDMDSCVTELNVVDTVPPIIDVCKDPEKDVFATMECELPYEALDLPTLTVNDACDGILYPEVIAYVKQKDSSVIVYRNEELKSAKYPTETHKIVWLFTDKAGNQDSCVMFVNVVDSVALQMDSCDVDKDIAVTVDPGKCSLPADSLKNYMKFPTAYDICDDDTIVPKIERYFEGELVTDETGKPIVWNSQDFPLGTTKIKWTFIDQKGLMKDSCEKLLTVKTELFDCSTLQDTVVVNLLDSFFATAEEVKLAGLRRPEIIIDNCNAATIGFSRSDGRDSTENYEIGQTVVSWTFQYVFHDTFDCKQIVKIEDMVPPVLECPPLPDTTYECYGEIPTPYSSFEEFLAAGGSISDIKKYKEGTFRYEETERGEAPCDYTLVRTYYITDVRFKDESCSQTFAIHDVTPPVIHTTVDTIKIACDQDSLIQEVLAMDDITIKATDNCSSEEEIVVKKRTQSNRSEDIHDCDYNNYTIWRSWTATDKCGNESEPLVQVILIIDSVAPKFVAPEKWSDTVLATNAKNCTMKVPGLTQLVGDFVHDLCTESEDIYVWQVPAEGEVIKEDTVVWVHFEDKCHNGDSIKMHVQVMTRESVVSMSAKDITICGSDTSYIDLWSSETRLAVGTIWLPFTNYRRRTLLSTFTYDCYRDEIDPANLVYSDNKTTYFDKFYVSNEKIFDSIRVSRTHLNKYSQSGKYVFVAMDTTTQCKDTAFAYLKINERPRINLASSSVSMCEDDTLDIFSLDSISYVCVDSMGAKMVKQGWSLDSVDYEQGTPVPFFETDKPLYYYAENTCGRTYSYNSLVTTCGQVMNTTKDSLDYVGGTVENLNKWRNYKVVRRDSILLTIHERFVPDSLTLVSDPEGLRRCWLGDEVTLSLNSRHFHPLFYIWCQVKDEFDGNQTTFDRLGNPVKEIDSEVRDSIMFSDLENLYSKYSFYPADSSKFYVLVGDGVCPAVPSNLYNIDVLKHVPTAFTPYVKDGLNDIFLEGRQVYIFDRYGQKIAEGTNGWDGTKDGKLVDPGVYFYRAVINGATFRGTIEVVYYK